MSCEGVLPKEASEVTSDGEGRWHRLNLSMQDLLIIERKSIPSHLKDVDCLEKPTTVEVVLRELEDAGEVTWFGRVLRLYLR